MCACVKVLYIYMQSGAKPVSHFMFNTFPSVSSDFCATLYTYTQNHGVPREGGGGGLPGCSPHKSKFKIYRFRRQDKIKCLM